MSKRIKSIEVTLHEPDLVDWLTMSVDRTDDEIEEAIANYCETYAELIVEAYPGAETVSVDTAELAGHDEIAVNGVPFGRRGAYYDYGDFGGAPEYIHRLEERMVDYWEDPKEA